MSGDDASFEPPLQLTAFEFRRETAGGRTKPWIVVAEDEHEVPHEIVLKFRHPAARGGHFHGTSLACEIICSVLARALGLNVPDYAVVEIPESLAYACPPGEQRELVRSNLGKNFGSRYLAGHYLWHEDVSVSDTMRQGLEDVLTFDGTVINGDRSNEKPNLLWQGEELVMIDHSLAVIAHMWDDETLVESPLLPDENVREHCAYRRLHRQPGTTFDRIHSAWSTSLRAAFAELRTWIPASWEHNPGDLDKIFVFLANRHTRFNDIASSLQRVMR